MGMPGKPEGIDGTDVKRNFLDGRIREIADYCETDVVNTYRVWLRYALFRGSARSRHVLDQRVRLPVIGRHRPVLLDRRIGRDMETVTLAALKASAVLVANGDKIELRSAGSLQ
jgi:hypothetical protein